MSLFGGAAVFDGTPVTPDMFVGCLFCWSCSLSVGGAAKSKVFGYHTNFHLLKNMYCVCLFGFNGNLSLLSLLEICA